MLTEKLCTGCTACYTVCPVRAISMVQDEFGAKYPKIDEGKCIHCSLCEKSCPVLQTKTAKKAASSILEVYAIQATDNSLRDSSSSGGLFSILAAAVLRQNGVVVGCAMTDDCAGAHHIIIDNEDDLLLLRGSKYIQSDMDNTLEQTVDFIRRGRLVLFSGTPCQVAGLHHALGEKRYDNIITVDFICHGVPVPFVWKKYLNEKEKEYKAKAKSVSFRNKKNGWKTYTLVVDFQNGLQYASKITEDPYLRGFINNAYLRNSCYYCRMKDQAYYSDITIADFWGVNPCIREMNDNKGTSLAIVHTPKALTLLDNCAEQMRRMVVSATAALASNPSYKLSVPYNPLRERIMQEITIQPFEKVIDYYYGKTIFSKIRRKLLTLVRKKER